MNYISNHGSYQNYPSNYPTNDEILQSLESFDEKHGTNTTTDRQKSRDKREDATLMYQKNMLQWRILFYINILTILQ